MRAITSTSKPCELCAQPASLYCHPDAAFLCRSCDADVHRANFLVARHLRHPLCSSCTSFCPASRCFSGSGTGHSDSHAALLCASCSPVAFSTDDRAEDCSSASSSTCVSTAESSAAEKIGSGRGRSADGAGAAASSSSSEPEASLVRKPSRRNIVVRRQPAVGAKREAVIASWCDRLVPDSAGGSVPRRVQLLALSLAESGSRGLPLRVSLAASFWLALRFCGTALATATWETLLGRVEAVSGVPRKLIVAASAKVARRADRPTKAKPDDAHLDLDLQEGWAECSA